jgi:thermitase
VTIKVSASDDSGATKISQQLYIDGNRVASATGGSLSYSWDLRKVSNGTHTIEALATDAAGNESRHVISVTR